MLNILRSIAGITKASLVHMRREVFMRDKAANIVLMLILNMMVIGTLVYKSRGGKVIDFSTSDGIITMLFLVAMAAVDVLYAVKLIRGSGK